MKESVFLKAGQENRKNQYSKTTVLTFIKAVVFNSSKVK